MPPAVEEKELPREQAVTESVAAPSWPFWGQYANTLPPWVDDLSRDFGDDIYERMLLDPQVDSCLDVLINGALAEELQITAAVKEGEPEHDQAAEIADFCRRNLERLDTLLTGVLPAIIVAASGVVLFALVRPAHFE